jgi:hypothetical protein
VTAIVTAHIAIHVLVVTARAEIVSGMIVHPAIIETPLCSH